MPFLSLPATPPPSSPRSQRSPPTPPVRLFHQSTPRTHAAKDSEVRPGRVSELYTNVRGNHNVVIYCRARHCGRLSRGRCDGSTVRPRENSFRIVRTRPDASIGFVSISLLSLSLDTDVRTAINLSALLPNQPFAASYFSILRLRSSKRSPIGKAYNIDLEQRRNAWQII